MDTSVLWNLGLTKNEIKIYLTLLDEGSSTAGIITEKTGIHRRNVYDSIERLIEKGIVGYIVVKGRKHFEAVDPKYFNRFFQEKKEFIDDQKKEFLKIYPFLEELYTKSKGKQEVTFYRGIEAIKLLLNNILDIKSTNHVIGAQKLKKEYAIIVERYHNRRIESKIKEKLIFDTDAKERGKIVSKLAYVDVRFFPNVYSNQLSINIYGDRVALLLYSDKNPLSIMIKNEEIHNGFMKYFEMLWEISIKANETPYFEK
ncbi:hypothetical protein HOD20_08470 [archaeon]|jgi:HTH-type transcriptional regulator, sugar sensing transcriptional regulator|nr:hypothetical protein [archaeon]MBT4352543.1 hypothetical protein [archaeon]MBT4647818.1 hypothetical protein [archaeon]MBT6821496.1 hypothetical protein [archaeon]MBT7392112.1 hypothetical protein [archaeon]